MDSEWRTLSTLSSDQLPIIVQLGSSFQINLPVSFRRTFTNLEKAVWDSHTREAEESFALLELSPYCIMGEPLFRKILNTSGKHHIPQGHIPNVIPNLNEIAKQPIF